MNRQWQFTVDGPLCGYQTHQHPNTPRAQRYVCWKETVRLVATGEGVPEVLNQGIAHEVIVTVRWKKAARIDADNCLKGITDSLWKRDRNVLKASVEVGEYTGVENVTVTVIERWVRRSTTGGRRGQASRRESRRMDRRPRPTSPDPYSREFRSRLT